MIKDRIKQVIEMLDLSYADFAEEIDVQPSSISHLVSGRNKPSLDFIEKLHQRYPDLQTDWLLYGKGFPFLQGKKDTPSPSPTLFQEEVKPTTERKVEKKEELEFDIPMLDTDKNATDNSQRLENGGKPIDMIIVLYKDGSFKEYRSKSSN